MSKYSKLSAVNTNIRAFFSHGWASMSMSLFNKNLSFRFSPYVGGNGHKFDYTKGMTASVNHEGAAFLYLVAKPILDGKDVEKQRKAELQCNKDTVLTFEYMSEDNNQMGAFLTICKNNQSITFRFMTHESKVNENGHPARIVIQSGLGAFAKAIEGYLVGIGSSLHLKKLPEEDFENYDSARSYDNFDNTNDEKREASQNEQREGLQRHLDNRRANRRNHFNSNNENGNSSNIEL